MPQTPAELRAADHQARHGRAGSARTSALRRLLDDLDPPSAVIVARDGRELENATQTLRTLGYHE